MDSETQVEMEYEAEPEAEEKPARNTGTWIFATVLVMILLGAAGFFGLPLLNNFFVQRYYQDSYLPIKLDNLKLGEAPEAHHIEGVPWISTAESLCQSTSLQMIATSYGLDQPRRFFDFLMGFTYGASEIPGQDGFFPGGTDPEIGFREAAPFFNRSANYYVTDDPEQYLAGLRHYLSEGYPIRVALDFAVLYEMKDQSIAHSEVLVGYDGENFTYYEPVCALKAPCEPGEKRPGGDGLVVTQERLLEAVLAQSKALAYPWDYAFTVFEPGPAATDLRLIWQRNGQTSIGDTRYGPKQGATVIEDLAKRIEKDGVDMDLDRIRQNLELAVYVRQENARFLREIFHGDANVELVATLFDQVAGKFQQVLAATEKPIAKQETATEVAGWLREAAAAERQAGETLLEIGR